MGVTKIYRNAIIASMQNAYIFFFTLGIYFVYIPWNLDRLKLVETDSRDCGFFVGIFNLIINQITAGSLSKNWD